MGVPCLSSPIWPVGALVRAPLSSSQERARLQAPSPSTKIVSVFRLPPQPPCVPKGDPHLILELQTDSIRFSTRFQFPGPFPSPPQPKSQTGFSRVGPDFLRPSFAPASASLIPLQHGAIIPASFFSVTRAAYVWICNYKLYLCESPRNEYSLIQPMCCFSPPVPEHTI